MAGAPIFGSMNTPTSSTSGAARRQPVLFVSHGSPTFAIESGSAGAALAAFGRSLTERPRGIVMISPHWIAREARVMTQAAPPTWHDFGGFPEALYRLQYPAPGSPALAARVGDLLRGAGVATAPDETRPFDHGAWVPMMHMFPQADVPMVQLALPAPWTPEGLYAIGKALAPLRDEGILIIASGSMTHNLRAFFGGVRPALHAPTERYTSEFARWVEDHLQQGDTAALLDYRRRAPHAALAHPTDEHFVTLFIAMGAADAAERPDYLTREVHFGHFAMDALAWGPH